MAVFKQRTSKGETQFYHYRFYYKGKNRSGVCDGCTTKKDAKAFEKREKALIKKGSEAETAKELHDKLSKEMFGDKVVKLSEAFEQASLKPRSRIPSEKVQKQKLSKWNDFLSYMKAKHPDIENLAEVKKEMAEGYIAYIQNNGRYNKEVKYKSGKTKKSYNSNLESLSAYSCNYSLMVLKEVFTKLYAAAGLLENPFSEIPKMLSDETPRDIFTEDELLLIRDSEDNFCTPLFTIGAMTALRLGDVCSLEWDHVKFKDQIISKVLEKTKTGKKREPTEIPILGTLYNYLIELYENRTDEKYVLPEQAKMYLSNNRSGVSWRIKKYLERLGINTSKKVEGRSRKTAYKDFHSLRHTFCYLAGIQGITLPVVQSIVGHMTPAMTKHYQSHASREDRLKAMKQMPEFLQMSNVALVSPETESERKELARMVQSLPMNQIKQILEYTKNKVKI